MKTSKTNISAFWLLAYLSLVLSIVPFVPTAMAATDSFLYGGSTDLPVVGDWDGNGINTVGVKRDNTYYLRNSNTAGVADTAFTYGSKNDTPVVGDWDGDGIATIGVQRGNTFYLRNSNTSGEADIVFKYGSPGDTPIVGDWDGDGIDTIGVQRGNSYYLRNSNSAGVADIALNYGEMSDSPVTGDWNGDGIDTIGVKRGNTYFLRNSNTSGVAEIVFTDGSASTDIPVIGDWDGDGITDTGFHRQGAWTLITAQSGGSVTPSSDTTAPSVPSVTPGSFEFSASAYSVSEGAGKVDITIKRVGGSAGAVAVDWRTNAATATFDADYGSFSWTTLTFADGETQKVKSITIPGDTLVEGDETFKVSLANPIGGTTLGTITTSVVTIKDDDFDSVPPPVVSDPIVSGPLPVFPGAKGFGVSTPGGRGGKVLKVTNLNDSGTGSLRAAVEATGPRIVVFEVSGTINLASKLNIYNPYLTIAGQTAPSPGITLKGCGFNVRSHDILIQHLRIRVGDDPNGPDPNERDAIQIVQTGCYNVVIDHVSCSWAVDENGSTWASLKDVTISNSVFSEGLYNSIHPEGAHSMGFIIGNNSKNVAFIGNLLAHNKERQPRVSGGVTAVIANNVMYNCGSSTHMDIGQSTSFSSPVPDIASQISVAGNVFIPGPNTPSTHRAMYVLAPSFNETTKVYLQDNKIINGTLFTYTTQTDPRVSTPPLSVPNLTVRPSTEAEAWVLANVGARPADRDAVDDRLVHEVATRTGNIIDSPGQVGGWPTLQMNTRTFPLPANPNGDDDSDGYTNVEEILHQMAAVVEGKTSP